MDHPAGAEGPEPEVAGAAAPATAPGPTRAERLESAYLLGPDTCCGRELRPFSLGSLLLCKLLPCRLVLEGIPADTSWHVIELELIRYLWLHSAPLPDVHRHLRCGTAARAVEELAFELDGEEFADAVPGLLDALAALPPLVNAASVKVIPKPHDREKEKGEPAELCEPGWEAQLLFTLSRELHWEEELLLYHLPLPRALQYYHCALRAAGAWTVTADGSSATPLPPIDPHKISKLLEAARAGSTPPRPGEEDDEDDDGLYAMPGGGPE